MCGFECGSERQSTPPFFPSFSPRISPPEQPWCWQTIVLDDEAPLVALAANDKERLIAYVLDTADPVITICSSEDLEPLVELARGMT